MALATPSSTLTGQTIADSYDQVLFLDSAAGVTEATLKIVSGTAGKTALQISDEHVLIKGVDTSNAAAFAVHTTGGALIFGVAADTPAITIGVDDTGADVRVYSATTNEGLLYDASEDELGLLLTTKLKFHDIGGGEEIYASGDGVLLLNSGTSLTITTPTLDLTSSTMVDFDSPILNTVTQGVTVELKQQVDSFTFDGASDNILSIDATNNWVGIGTAAPDAPLHVADTATYNHVHFDTFSTTDAEFTSLQLRKSSSATIGTFAETVDGEWLGEIVFRGVDSGSNADIGVGIQAIQDGDSGSRVPAKMVFITCSEDAVNQGVLTLGNDANVTVGTGNLIIGTAGKGIDFSAQSVGAASGTTLGAELLDHYEEGYATAAFVPGGSGSITIDGGADQFSYTRIGRVVHVLGGFNIGSVSSPAGYVKLQGLPYAAANLTEAAGKSSVNVYLNTLASGSLGDVVAEIPEGESEIHIYFGDGTSFAADVAETFQSTTDVRFQATYFAA
jgi:hypothetical protein